MAAAIDGAICRGDRGALVGGGIGDRPDGDARLAEQSRLGRDAVGGQDEARGVELALAVMALARWPALSSRAEAKFVDRGIEAVHLCGNRSPGVVGCAPNCEPPHA